MIGSTVKLGFDATAVQRGLGGLGGLFGRIGRQIGIGGLLVPDKNVFMSNPDYYFIAERDGEEFPILATEEKKNGL